MKNKTQYFLLVFFIGISFCVQAQLNLDVTGDGKISDENGDFFLFKVSGNNTGLEIRDSDGSGVYNQPYIDFSNDASVDYDVRFIFDADEIFTVDSRGHDFRFNTTSGEKVRFTNNGRVGIGTNTPLVGLHLSGNKKFRIDGTTTHTQFSSYNSGDGSGHVILQIDPTPSSNDKNSVVRLFRSVNAENVALIIMKGNNTTQINHVLHGRNNSYLSMTGNLGIGTTNTLGYKLAVKGNIGAEGIEVRTNYWADFVFENDYDLRSLEDVEKFIKENGHLPEIPSATEATSTPHNLGNMDVKLLQKIEELTLYTIEQEKVLQQQQQLIGELKIRLDKLENQNK